MPNVTIMSVRRKSHGGFTMLELTAALFILTVGLFGVISMYQFGIAKMHAINESAVAMSAIQNEIETLRSIPFAEIENVENAPFRSSTPITAKLVNATPTVTISDYGEPSRSLKKVTVALIWTGEHGRTIEKRITTLISDRGK